MAINGVKFRICINGYYWDFLFFAINAINGVLLMAIYENSTINDINAINGY